MGDSAFEAVMSVTASAASVLSSRQSAEHLLSALIMMSSEPCPIDPLDVPSLQLQPSCNLKRFERILHMIDRIDQFRDQELLYDFVALAWDYGEDEIVGLIAENPSCNLRDVYWKHSAFNASRKALDVEIQTMKPIKPQEEGIYQCSKCGSRQTSVVKAQTRSADEGMTDFVTCHNCGKKWKVNN